tara:strand:+ start:835 stop:1344 length:510 start_codon:yes stop_codon:yes gene_type:complete
MDESFNKTVNLKDKLTYFYNKNKFIIFMLLGAVIVAIAIIIFNDINSKTKNKLIADKYVKAGIYLASDEKEKSKYLYEEIIKSKNKFYSLLAFNAILEKNLIKDKEKIISYFNILEKINYSDNTSDLIVLKKALYLIKNSDIQKGNKLIKDLIDKNSNLKSLSEEILIK